MPRHVWPSRPWDVLRSLRQEIPILYLANAAVRGILDRREDKMTKPRPLWISRTDLEVLRFGLRQIFLNLPNYQHIGRTIDYDA